MQTFPDCGHNKEWALRLRGAGRLHVYCIGCIVEKLGIEDKNGPKEDAKIKLEKTLEEGSKANGISYPKIKKQYMKDGKIVTEFSDEMLNEENHEKDMEKWAKKLKK